MARSNFNQDGIAEKNSKSVFKRSALSIALGLCVAGGVQAQSTTGSIFGDAPAGSTVTIKNNAGFNRTVTVGANGEYSIRSLPVGDYTVTAKQDGEVVGTRNVPVHLGAGANASFGGSDNVLETVTVTGTKLTPDIDVSSTDTRVVLTSEDLKRLPMSRSAEAIALLAPGVNQGAEGYFDDMVSFGGSGVSENGYYINGFLANDPLSNLGGFSLPYGAISQQETYTGGYGSKYGRSSGGVINQVGARGDNEFHFGSQVVVVPKGLRAGGPRASFPNVDFSGANANPNIPFRPELDDEGNRVEDANGDIVYTDEKYQYRYENADLPGTLYERKKDDFSWSNTYSAYASGPLIEDKLFAFVSMETELEEEQNAPNATQSERVEDSENDDTKIYAKLDWYITQDHLLEYTYMGENYESEGTYNAWDLENGKRGERLEAVPNRLEERSEFTILNYTGYLTDTLTLNAMYGHGSFSYTDEPGAEVTVPYIQNSFNQDPDANNGNEVTNRAGGYQARNAHDYTDGVRVNLEWALGDHTLAFGIDNMEFESVNEGTTQVTDVWIYRQGDADVPINSTFGVGAPGGEGYYAEKYIYQDATSMKLEQDAYYLEDRWQVTDDVLLSLGVRNDKFTNYNNTGAAYLESDDQWAPRLGASWDVFGDSSLKLFANAGRYYLAMPNNVAIRGASASTYTREYFTYEGVAEDGSPTGRDPLGPGPVSSNGEYGEPVDPLDFAPSDLESMYQDEYILGFEKTLGDNYNFGAKFTFRDLKSAMDDVCDPYRLIEAAGYEHTGYTPEGKVVGEKDDGSAIATSYCFMFNPGGSNTFSVANLDANGNPDGTRTEVTMGADDWELPNLKRQYSAIDLFIERPFDGKWEARLDYTYSKLEGNTEGQVKSEFGQDNISKTQDWDVSEMMRHSTGYTANDRRHQLKIRGSYALTEELMLTANARIMSGMPVSCLGFYNPDGSTDAAWDGDPVGYGSSYHTCFGEVATPGKVRTPWTRNLDMGLSYNPGFFDKRLRLNLDVFNVLNEQKPLQLDVTAEEDPYTVSNTYTVPLGYQAPRYVMLSASLDF